MPSFVYPQAGIDDVAVSNLTQILDAWTGVPAKGIPLSVTAINDPINFAVAVKNLDATNSRGLQVLKTDGTVLLQVDAAGVKVSPDGSTAGVPLTTTGAQTLTNKTLTSPQITGGLGVGAAADPAIGINAAVNGATTGASQFAILSSLTSTNSGTTEVSGLAAKAVSGNSGTPYTTTTLSSLHAQANARGSNSTVTSNYGLLVDAQIAGNANNYGIYVAAPSGGSGANMGVRIAGGAPALQIDAGGFRTAGDPGALAGYLGISTTFGVGNAAGGNITAPGLGTGGGPSNPLAVVTWLKIYEPGGVTRWLPVFA